MLEEIERKKGLNCPYCCIYALFDFCELRKKGSIEIRDAMCPHCNKTIVEVREVSYTSKSKLLGGIERLKNYGEWTSVWPNIKVLCNDEKIPIEVRDDLNNANSIVDISPDAAAGLVRRALEQVLKKYLKLSGKRLIDLISSSESLLHPKSFRLLDSLREYGNFGTHLKEDVVDREFLLVTKDEAVFSINVLKGFIEEEFVHKSKVDEMLQQLEQKKQRRDKKID